MRELDRVGVASATWRVRPYLILAPFPVIFPFLLTGTPCPPAPSAFEPPRGKGLNRSRRCPASTAVHCDGCAHLSFLALGGKELNWPAASRGVAAALRLRPPCSAPARKGLRPLSAAAAAHCGGGAGRGAGRCAPRPPARPARPHCGAAACAAHPARRGRRSTGHALCGGLRPLKPLQRNEEGDGAERASADPSPPQGPGPSLLCASD